MSLPSASVTTQAEVEMCLRKTFDHLMKSSAFGPYRFGFKHKGMAVDLVSLVQKLNMPVKVGNVWTDGNTTVFEATAFCAVDGLLLQHTAIASRESHAHTVMFCACEGLEQYIKDRLTAMDVNAEIQEKRGQYFVKFVPVVSSSKL
jgi:hypothetical protein